MTLLLERVEESIVSATPGLWTKAMPPPKSLAVLFCSRRSIESVKAGVHKLEMQHTRHNLPLTDSKRTVMVDPVTSRAVPLGI